MYKFVHLPIIALTIFSMCFSLHSHVDSKSIPQSISKPPEFDSFTGKITRNKVRMRLQPNLEAPILRELDRDDLLSIVGEVDEFYAITPPKDTKAYVFRTFVLDNIIEGNRVNVRLEPALDAPVIAQLNNGDRIEGTVSPLSSKWLEISPPSSTCFYVCKEYVEKIGGPELLAQIDRRQEEVATLLKSARLKSEIELQKSYPEIRIQSAIANLNAIIKTYPDFPKSVENAKELLAQIHDAYLKKKIRYLEAKALAAEEKYALHSTSATLQLLESNSEEISSSQQQNEEKKGSEKDPFSSHAMTSKMAAWIPIELALYEAWAMQRENSSPRDFYDQQSEEAISLQGTIEPYLRNVKNKPGDYVLVQQKTGLLLAYLYSTQINLNDFIGKEVTLNGLKRPNNHFAFPAYFVTKVEVE